MKFKCPKCGSEDVVEQCLVFIQYDIDLVKNKIGELYFEYGDSEVIYGATEPLDRQFYCKNCCCEFNCEFSFDLTTFEYKDIK